MSAVFDPKTLVDRIAPDPTKLLEVVLRGTDRWSLTQKIAGAAVSLIAAAATFGLGSPRATVAGVFALIGISILTVQRRVVEAQSFVLKDEKHQKRGVLGMSPEGPLLALLDTSGKPRLYIAVQDLPNSGPAILLNSEAGTETFIASGTQSLRDKRTGSSLVSGAVHYPRIHWTMPDANATLIIADAGEGNQPSLVLDAGSETVMATVNQKGGHIQVGPLLSPRWEAP